jgi:hypothetical protein
VLSEKQTAFEGIKVMDVKYYADIIDMGVYYNCEISQLTEILESALNHPNDYIRKQATLLLNEDEEKHNKAREYLASQ